MSSFGIKVPIQFDSSDGFTMLKTIKQTVKQNFKMLILTIPGERVMDPNYGVGLKQFLFENFSSVTQDQVKSRIKEQVSIYLPVVTLKDIQVTHSTGTHTMNVQITYSIPDLGIRDLLEFTI